MGARIRPRLEPILLAVVASLGCGSPSIPDPAPVVRRFSEACRRGDDRVLYQLLTVGAQRSLGRARVKELVAEQRAELGHNADKLTAVEARIEVEARARFVEGDMATLVVEDGELRLQSAAAFPARATTVEQALAELRAALLRRSYPGLLAVLTRESAAGFEEKINSLVDSLADAPALEIDVRAGRAVITLPRGHRIELWQEAGLWKVRDFE